MKQRLGHGGWSFLAFPDRTESSTSAVTEDRLRVSAIERIDHPSGRPFVVGTWADREITVGKSDDRLLVLIGTTSATNSDLVRFLQRRPSLQDTDDFRPAGSYCLLASFGGEVLLRGPVSELRRVFYADHMGSPIASSDAGVLAELIGAPVSATSLALGLLSPFVPHPTDRLLVWDGVHPVPGEFALQVSTAGRPRLRRHWFPPDPSGSPEEVGSAVRRALENAVSARMVASAPTSCDLSGGLDSTPLFQLAAAHSADVQAFTTGSQAVFDTEMEWAAQAVGDKTRNPRIVLPAAGLPTPFMNIDSSLGCSDGVYVGEPIKMRWRAIARHLRAAGSVLHLTGHGGDELFTGGLAALRDAFRTHPGRALVLARGQQALRRESFSSLSRWMVSGESYRTWSRRSALHLSSPPKSIGWNNPVLASPPWMSSQGLECSRLALLNDAHSAQPLSRHAGQHEAMEALRNGGRITRYDTMLMAQYGIQMEAPYFDDAVVTAALSLSPHAALDPWTYKPALKAAISGLVPERIRSRVTKTESTGDIWRGLREHRPAVEHLTSSMRLAELGIVDEAAFRTAVYGPHPPSLTPISVWKTLACEGWLRDLSGDRPHLSEEVEGPRR